MDNKKTRCEIVEVGMPSTHFPLCDKGVPRNCIDITIKEIFSDGSFLRHAGSFTVYESELGQYVDFAKTRFSSYYGKIFVRDLGKYLR